MAPDTRASLHVGGGPSRSPQGSGAGVAAYSRLYEGDPPPRCRGSAPFLSIGASPTGHAAPASSTPTTAWKVVSSPSPDSTSNVLDSVAIVSASDGLTLQCAKGTFTRKTLIEQFTG